MLIFDIETDGLIEDLTRIFCLVIIDTNDNNKVYDYKEDNVQLGLDKLMKADKICGHNIIGFDIPAIQKLHPDFKVRDEQIVDTLILSRLIYSDITTKDGKLIAQNKLDSKLYRSHSLKAWGQRLGFPKGDYDMTIEENRREWNLEMHNYCIQDCKVTTALLKHFDEKNYSQEAIKLEHDVALVTTQMQKQGIYFDEPKAQELYKELLIKKQELETKLQETFEPWVVEEPPVISKVTNKKTGRVKGEPFIKKKTIIFNPGSRQHISNRLIALYGWEPREFTPSGQPKVDESIINVLPYPEAKLIGEYLTISKRLGQLAEGEQAWLNHLREDKKIHGFINTNGTVTGRASHAFPNLAQVPASGSPYGADCRSLFCADPGFKLVGADLSGLELRCLAHYLCQFDGGEYTKQLCDGDIHTFNQRAAGLNTRDQAKRFIYSLIYGAGAPKLGEVIGGSAADGGRIKTKFFKAMPALKKLIDGCIDYSNKHGYLPGLDRRELTVRSEHGALNVLLQSAGALIAKKALVLFNNKLKEHNLQDRVQLLLWIHDEFQIQYEENIDEGKIGRLAVDCFKRAGEYFEFNCPITGEFKDGRNWHDTH